MGERTEISWAHSTFNPWIGCTRVSPGCDHCYAATLMDERYGRVKWGTGEARSRTKTWGEPLRWNRLATASGRPWRVFCASLADVFDNEVAPAWRADLFDLIEATPALTWMLLTKRIGNVRASVSLPANVWLGITVVNQEEADRDIPKLLALPGPLTRWLSCEPLLGPLDLTALPFRDHREGFSQNVLTGEATFPARGVNGHPDIVVRSGPRLMPRIDWVIVGGESGPGARPMNPEWVRSLRDQCARYGVPFHFKQWGEWVSVSEVAGMGAHHTFPDGRTVRRVGKLRAGHTLDGREHREFPAIGRES
jgi:protein gp37